MRKILLKTNPYKHQAENLKYILRLTNSADWSEPGTGKSITALYKAALMFNMGLIKKILICCPLSVSISWGLEIEQHTTFSYINLFGSMNNKIYTLQASKDIFIISYDSLSGRKGTYGILLKKLIERKFDLLVGDEVTMVKSYGSLRTRAFTILCDSIKYKIFMSGTPITDDPLDIFPLYRALDKGKTFGKNFFVFRNSYFKNIGTYYPDWVLKEGSINALSDKMRTISVRSRKEECLDLPPKIWSPRLAFLSKEQREIYHPIAQDIIKLIDLEEGQVLIKNVLGKLLKLSQITSGFLYTDTDVMRFNHNTKIDLLSQVVAEFPKNEKFVVFSVWREDLKILKEWAEQENINFSTLEGTVEDRKKAVMQFQTDPSIRLLLSNINIGKYSLTLTASSTIIYYSLNFSVESFIQSSDRIHRISQKSVCLYLPLLLKNTIDTYIYKCLLNKVNLSTKIVDNDLIKNLNQRSE